MQASTPDELLSSIVRFAQAFEFERVGAMVVVDGLRGEPEFFGVHNAPEVVHASLNDREAARRDPVMQHCKGSNLPITWGPATYTAAGEGELWEEQARYGYGYGIAMAMHLPGGRHFMLGVDRDRRLPDDPLELSCRVADFQLLTTCAQEAALRIFAPPAEEAIVPALSRRELDTLRWTMEGKTAWEAGKVLGISERTAVMYLNQAMRKLGSTSKHQAVLKALRMGLLR